LERRTISNVALAASAVAVAVALGNLMIRVKAESPALTLGPAELAQSASSPVPPAEDSLPRIPPPRADLPPAPAPAIPPPTEAIESPAAPEIAPAPTVEVGETSGEAGLVPEPGAREAQGVAGEAIRSYDGGDYEAARTQAIQALEQDPNDQHMLRIVTGASCILGDVEQARSFIERLTPSGRRLMARRCSRYGVEL
jgi:hypothetical protein